MKKFLIILLAVGMLLSCLGCSGETPQETQGTEQTLETEASQDTEQPSDTDTPDSTTQATLSADDPRWAEILAGPLTKDADYCAESSGYTMAETEDGYYLVIGCRICYADKSDLSTWYPVCSDPSCSHTIAGYCNSILGIGENFCIWDDRIHFINSEDQYIQESSDKYAVYSISLDGSDLQEDYCFDTTLTEGTNSTSSLHLTPEYGYGQFGKLNSDGMWEYQVLRVNASGTEVLWETTLDNDQVYTYMGFCTGKFGITGKILSGEEGTLYFPTEDGMQEAASLPLWGSCVMEDAVYYYEDNVGFFTSDWDGGNPVLITENQLEDGFGFCLTERLYLETNMEYGLMPEEPIIRLFDGEDWYDLELAEDFWINEKSTIQPLTVSSERMFLYTYDSTDWVYRLYSIDLSQKPYVLELNATIENPNLFDSN